MRRDIQISIPSPCHENWDKMTAAEKGKFCGSCQKTVYDFTKSSDRDILQQIGNTQNLCGRFLPSQLERNISIPKEKSSIWIAAASGFLAFIGLGSEESTAQEKAPITQTPIREGFVLGKPARPNINKIIYGMVSDENGPLPGASIWIEGTDRGTQTDFSGKFSINVTEGEILNCSYVGKTDQKVPIDKHNAYKLVLQDNQMVRGEIVTTGMGIIRRR